MFRIQEHLIISNFDLDVYNAAVAGCPPDDLPLKHKLVHGGVDLRFSRPEAAKRFRDRYRAISENENSQA